MDKLENDQYAEHVVLRPDEYLDDIFRIHYPTDVHVDRPHVRFRIHVKSDN